MTWADFYLFCFAFGFFFSLISVLFGHLHIGHDGAGHGHHGHMPHAVDAHGHGHGHGHAHGHGGGGDHTSRAEISPLNMGTLSAFLAWFGGTGYMATKFYHLVVIGTLALSLCAGLAGASIVFWFLRKVLMRDREELDPADYDMVGVLGRVSENIRREGLGEVLFSQAGTRHSVAARSEDDKAIPNGTEVVVTRYENGIAYVRRWDELAEIADAHPGGN